MRAQRVSAEVTFDGATACEGMIHVFRRYDSSKVTCIYAGLRHGRPRQRAVFAGLHGRARRNSKNSPSGLWNSGKTSERNRPGLNYEQLMLPAGRKCVTTMTASGELSSGECHADHEMTRADAPSCSVQRAGSAVVDGTWCWPVLALASPGLSAILRLRSSACRRSEVSIEEHHMLADTENRRRRRDCGCDRPAEVGPPMQPCRGR